MNWTMPLADTAALSREEPRSAVECQCYCTIQVHMYLCSLRRHAIATGGLSPNFLRQAAKSRCSARVGYSERLKIISHILLLFLQLTTQAWIKGA